MNQTKTSNKSRIDAGGKQGGKWRWAVDVIVIGNETVVLVAMEFECEQAPVFRAGSCDLEAANCTAPPLDLARLATDSPGR